jgi:hypothetical protein
MHRACVFRRAFATAPPPPRPTPKLLGAFVGLKHQTRAKMSADDRAPSPAAATPPAKRARLVSPARSPWRDTMDAAGADGRDVPVDALDAHGAPAATTGGVAAPAPAPTTQAATAAAPKKKGKRKPRHALPELCAPEDVVARDVAALLGADAVAAAVDAGTEWDAPFAPDVKEELTLEVTMFSSNGACLCSARGLAARVLRTLAALPLVSPLPAPGADAAPGEGLARLPAPAPPWAVLVPFALPGETVRARVYRHARLHSFADLVAVETPNPELRDMDRVKCRYFGACAGCQYQVCAAPVQRARAGLTGARRCSRMSSNWFSSGTSSSKRSRTTSVRLSLPFLPVSHQPP